ncbi:MAG: FAD-dependent oxidoreductase [Gammaproteobacteria bacterium]|nr:FAD-dependent oxidoreductase [Gammaproteobacteria bacterium]MDH3859042.1 FAD-dependent oxidoreductase [Gammaproteobacteria bacterium]
MTAPIVIVGAGQAAASFITRHVALASKQPVLLIGEESYLPYQRPPLSKKYLIGELDRERLFIRPPEWYQEQNINLRLNSRIDAIDRDDRKVVTTSGESIEYDKLLLCTGSSARSLPVANGGDLDRVFTLRSIDDTDKMSPEFQPGRKLLIIGGGYIGLEAAASARQMGLEVTLLEMAERILQRVAAAATSSYFRELHLGHGVDLRESVRMTSLLGEGGIVSGAALETGEVIDADLVLVGIGSSPNTGLAQAAGLDCDNGIRVNEICQTSDPNIYAAGDCTNFVRNGQHIRLESVQNAADQGDLVARVLAGEAVTYTALPWFWSEQYDCRLQIVGLSQGHNQTVFRPGADPSIMSVWYYRDDELLAIDAMNEPKSYAFGTRIIAAGKNPTPAEVADPETDLKVLALG